LIGNTCLCVNVISPKKDKTRFMGKQQANTSSKSPDELDNLSYLDMSDPEEFGDLMISLHNRFGIKVLGGCCGSDCNHITEIAKRIKSQRPA